MGCWSCLWTLLLSMALQMCLTNKIMQLNCNMSVRCISQIVHRIVSWLASLKKLVLGRRVAAADGMNAFWTVNGMDVLPLATSSQYPRSYQLWATGSGERIAQNYLVDKQLYLCLLKLMLLRSLAGNLRVPDYKLSFVLLVTECYGLLQP